ncbi:MAG: hypothetical protein ABW092_09720 [Candidatus Thiodiazotropha sp.]
MLKKYLSEKKNFHARESIFMSRLSYDLKLAAAKRDYYLKTYFEDVDHDGFDVIFDDDDSIVKIQVKTLLDGSSDQDDTSTNNWEIHKCILRPQIHLLDKLGFESSPEGEGVGGGFIRMDLSVDDDDNVNVRYHYTDLFVLLAYDLGILPYSRRKTLDEKLRDLQCGTSHEKIGIPKGLIVQAKSPEALLALMGIHSNESFSWRYLTLVLANHENQYASREMPLPMPIEELRRSIKQELDNLLAL